MNDMTIKNDNPLVKLNEQLEARSSQFQAALPAHIPVERFKRVVLTAIQQNPKLASADRPTLFTSAMKAAQDGLLPDGREGALVIYNTKMKINGQEKWVDAVQWIPMVAGLRKKVRNSGQIATWDVKAVFEKDEFLYEEGLDVILKHKPYLDGPAGDLKAVYSVCKMKTGEVSIDVMAKWQVDRIRAMSKAKDRGPWVDHYVEMAKKTVARRHSKVLPMNTDLDDLIRRDDDLYDMEGSSDKVSNQRRPQLSDFTQIETSAPVDSKPGAEAAPQQAEPVKELVDQETGEVLTADETISEPSAADAHTLGFEARMANKPKRVPPEVDNAGQAFSEAWMAGWDDADEELAASRKKK